MGRSHENVSAQRRPDRTDADSGGRRGPAHFPAMDSDRSQIMMARLWPPAFTLKKEPVAWLAAGLASLLLFFFLTFPFGTLQARVLSELVRATGWDLRAADW